MGGMTISRESPLGAGLALLFERHTAAMHEDTPPGSIHMMDAGRLCDPSIAFFVMRDNGRAIGMGAIKDLGDRSGEIKSMHILYEARGRGLARLMLDHLIAEARALGLERLNLETGSQPSFEPARSLYRSAGFSECGPFGGYGPDPNSTFMSCPLG